ITSIVDTIISYERIPVSFLEQDKELKTQQVAAYKAVLAKFIALQTQVSLLKRESSFDKASIDISDETILTASASGRVTSGSYNLRVLSLARNHQLASRGVDSATTNVLGTGSIKLSVGQAGLTTINVDEGNNSLIGLKDAINEADVGIRASIINDGTSSKPHRLLLTAEKTGAANQINLEVGLTGGESLDFTGSSFDNPEKLSFSTEATSAVSLGSTASYTGNENKIYSFTVAGEGTQIVGTDIITLNWTDGTNSGSVLVTQADTEVELIGAGAYGLKLSFSAGDMVGGDTFQVTTFAPLLQAASDAQVAIGSDGIGGGSPIIINSETNEFEEVIPGLTINVKNVSPAGQSVAVSTDIDTDAIKQMVNDLISKYNDVMDFIDDQFTYNQDTRESGVLFAEYPLQVMQASLRTSATLAVSELKSEINSLSAIGVRSKADGKLSLVNSARLIDTIQNDLSGFIKLFTDSAVSSSPFIEFISASEKVIPGDDYEVDITQVATRGYFQGAIINDPAVSPITLDGSNNVIKLNVDGRVSDDIVLSERTYSSGDDLANEIQTRIDSDSRLKGMDVSVEWIQTSEGGYVRITSGTYGSGSRVQMVTAVANNAYSLLGLSSGSIHSGQDVAGTINGEKATGKGQVLSGEEGNRTTEGLKLKITLSANQLSGGAAEGTISVALGLSTKIYRTLENITKTVDGSIARRTSALNNQIEAINKQIDNYDKRLQVRRESLYNQFLAMENALAEYQAEGSYLEAQLKNITNNFNMILKRE
ncbi:MAG: flagellar filament capping protein FliD, partial [Candidatus Zixiibacteriota bacterium]